MNLAIAKREAIARWMIPASLVATVLMALVAVGIAQQQDRNTAVLEGVPGFALLFHGIVCVSAFVYYDSVRLQHRVTEFERALPVSRRSILLQRFLALWAAFAVPLAFATITLLISRWIWDLRASVPVVLGGAAATLGTISLITVLPFAYRPRQASLSSIETVLVAAAAAAAGVAAIMVASPTLWASYGVAAAALAAVSYALVPKIDPMSATSQAHPARGARDRATLQDGVIRLLGPTRYVLLRSTILRSRILGMTVAVGIFAALLPDSSFFRFWFTGVLAYTTFTIGLNLLHGTDALPIDRRRVLRMLALPTAAFVALAAGLGANSVVRYDNYEPIAAAVDLDRLRANRIGPDGDYGVHVRVPPAFWRIGTSEASARIVSPTGEAHDPEPHPLFWGAPAFAYSPYGTGEERTVRFTLWQLSRALEDVHGVKRTVEELHTEAFTDYALSTPLGETRGIKEWSSEALPSAPPANFRWARGISSFLIWLLVGSLCLMPNVPRIRAAFLTRKVYAFCGGATVLLLGAALTMQDSVMLRVVAGRIHVRIDQMLSGSPAGWACLLVAVAGASYALLSRRIARIETPSLTLHPQTKQPYSIW